MDARRIGRKRLPARLTTLLLSADDIAWPMSAPMITLGEFLARRRVTRSHSRALKLAMTFFIDCASACFIVKDADAYQRSSSGHDGQEESISDVS